MLILLITLSDLSEFRPTSKSTTYISRHNQRSPVEAKEISSYPPGRLEATAAAATAPPAASAEKEVYEAELAVLASRKSLACDCRDHVGDMWRSRAQLYMPLTAEVSIKKESLLLRDIDTRW